MGRPSVAYTDEMVSIVTSPSEGNSNWIVNFLRAGLLLALPVTLGNSADFPCKDCLRYGVPERQVRSRETIPNTGKWGEDRNATLRHGDIRVSTKMRRTVQSELPQKVNSQCQYPCKCSNAELRCKAGVNAVKDGCDCCYMCARQQGDLCDYKDRCDEEKGFYCDFQLEGGQRGICRAKDAHPCQVEGSTYKDGEEFKLGCRRLCTCQNGQYACSTLCPQEERRPSSVHCPNPRLIAIKDNCCREWTCPTQHDENNGVPEESYPDELSPGRTDAPAEVQRECRKETSPWSACSTTCDMGYSVRVTNDNEDCMPVQQRRLCLVRPCEMQDNHLTGKHCKTIHRAEEAFKFTHDGCTSVKDFRPKYCSTCKKGRCCWPDATKTLQVEFECPESRIRVMDFMWTKSCKCAEVC